MSSGKKTHEIAFLFPKTSFRRDDASSKDKEYNMNKLVCILQNVCDS